MPQNRQSVIDDLSVSQVCEISFGTTDQDVALVNANRQTIQRIPFTRTRNTKSSTTLVERAMCVAHQIPPVLADKLIANKIQGGRHMPAPIHVSMEASTI